MHNYLIAELYVWLFALGWCGDLNERCKRSQCLQLDLVCEQRPRLGCATPTPHMDGPCLARAATLVPPLDRGQPRPPRNVYFEEPPARAQLSLHMSAN